MLKHSIRYQEMIETEYDIKNERQAASLFTTGNGYFGVRGSFEEYATISVQGSYIRGLFDEIYELPDINIDNIYMRKYYFNEEKARTFEKQESCINYCDFLLIRFKIGDFVFYPWEGKVIHWERYIDTQTGALIREVHWQDPKGNISLIKFFRTASFDSNHIYLMEASVERINHNLPVTIISGVDTIVKTNGQIISKLIDRSNKNNVSSYIFNTGNKYNNIVGVTIRNEVTQNCDVNFIEEKGRFYHEYLNIDQDIVRIQKTIYVSSSIDGAKIEDSSSFGLSNISELETYHTLLKNHVQAYIEAFNMINIVIEGNDEDDSLLRYANYQTLIGLDRYDQVHSISAKNLTSDKYNQFVWWDAEIYQLPMFYSLYPNAGKNALMYRYNRLEKARENAKNEGFKGAKFAFCSGSTGEELVWSYARHPFMQIHINSDIAYSTMRYLITTMDMEFYIKYGLEMICEIFRYFISRVTYNELDDSYELKNVTGTDEHHPYIDNNTYTNYMLKCDIKLFFEISKLYNLSINEYLTKNEVITLKKIMNKIVIPKPVNGVTPQFSGYFDLNPALEVSGNGAGKGFQMKESGLYHKSQIIKQPDLMMLYSYCNVDFLPEDYEFNWEYYEQKCEKSSSLSYPVHAICSIDNNQLEKFYKYFKESLRIDIDDLHHGAHQGLHAACMAGGWYSIYRGLFGVKERIDYLEINPKKQSFYDKIKINFIYQGTKINLTLVKDLIYINCEKPINIRYRNQKIKNVNSITFEI